MRACVLPTSAIFCNISRPLAGNLPKIFKDRSPSSLHGLVIQPAHGLDLLAPSDGTKTRLFRQFICFTFANSMTPISQDDVHAVRSRRPQQVVHKPEAALAQGRQMEPGTALGQRVARPQSHINGGKTHVSGL